LFPLYLYTLLPLFPNLKKSDIPFDQTFNFAVINYFLMKKSDLLFLIVFLGIFIPFIISKPLFDFYQTFNRDHGMLASFIKFAILATMGEMIALRIRKGVYNEPGFGIAPRAVVWGFIGLAIKMAFTVFSTGTPIFMEYLGIKDSVAAMKGSFSGLKLLNAFCISVAMNVIFAPVMMTFHKITDTHITKNGGKLSCLLKKIEFAQTLKTMNWDVMWNFVFLRTIPLFWFPAHTITFLLPPEFQVLFAALLGIALGLILAFASLKGAK
jgi:hypothetical protein